MNNWFIIKKYYIYDQSRFIAILKHYKCLYLINYHYALNHESVAKCIVHDEVLKNEKLLDLSFKL